MELNIRSLTTNVLNTFDQFKTSIPTNEFANDVSVSSSRSQDLIIY